MLAGVLNVLVNGIRILAFFLVPFAPDLAGKIMVRFGINCYEVNFTNLLDFSNVDGLKIEKNLPHLFT